MFDNNGVLRLISPGGGSDTVVRFKQIHIYAEHPVLDVRLVTTEGEPERIKTSMPYVLALETTADYVPKAELKP